ncbi:ATP-grasp domain-containing protein [Halomonas caseinilytica]|uniref:ATP-grasp domain-containing protein n=1 Tax=Halomonas caseinilytica TaxID=438744 RepID=UPI000849221A|nr:hypothetical protein [Halomonas caseinilytica]
MILVAGGQFDVNLRALHERLSYRDIPFCSLLVGPNQTPNLRIDIQGNRLEVNDSEISPTACFIRHDVFLHQASDRKRAQTSALNWFQAVRGWAVSQPSVRVFNRHSYLCENNKVQNLLLAQAHGLPIPDTVVVNDLSNLDASAEAMVHKPVAGGEYTGLVSELRQSPALDYPRFIQPRLQRPEMRIYRIGPALMAFWLYSSELDYRRTQDVEIVHTAVPHTIGNDLIRLLDHLELDFAAADFMADEEGTLHFLEVNTQPMFAAFDRATHGKLCDAIIDGLSY